MMITTRSHHVFAILVVFLLACPGGHAQCAGTITFEKVSGLTPEAGVSTSPLFRSRGNAVTAECNNRCREDLDCDGFLVNYENDSCFDIKGDNSIQDNGKERRNLINAPGRVNFFEKICLKAPTCEKAWLFERVPGFELAGFDSLVASNVNSRAACQELCLESVDLPCRSAEYDYDTLVCRLSTETRRTQPTAYRASTSDVDYLENQCASDKDSERTCDYVEYENQDIGFADLRVRAGTMEECRRRCETTIAFNCRSFTFVPAELACFLSGDDNISAGPEAVAIRQGANYYQRAPCVDSMTAFFSKSRGPRIRRQLSGEPDDDDQYDDEGNIVGQKAGLFSNSSLVEVSLSCTATDMTVTLNTEDAFTGKIFAVSNPKSCFTRGSGDRRTALTFEYEDPEGRCGVELEEKGVFSNTIVVQHHPIIQQKGDRAVKLYCFFEVTGDKVVTNSYDVIAETVEPRDPSAPVPPVPGIPTSVVNGTAPQPQVRLRITNEDGDDIDGTRLGESLFLRIELDGESIFDIFAKNLIAQSGVDEEEIKLLDDRGCPTDPVFPGLTKDNETGALIGRFEAFKFSDSSVVNFQVNVQFCQGTCNPVDCGDGVQSFGRRKRRSTDTTEIPEGLAQRLVFDPNLKQEVITYDTPLRKQIFVEPGTKVDEFRDPVVRTGGNGVFVAGDFDIDDVFCASWTVVIVTAASFIFLQFCILVVCVLCIYASRRGSKNDDNVTYAPTTTSITSGSSPSSLSGHPHRAESTLAAHYVDPHHLINRSQSPYSGFYVHKTAASSANTLKSLRTSLRD